MENNIGAAKDMLNVADGAMSGITDYLQKIRELGVRASNTVTITDAERTSIQAQIEQYKPVSYTHLRVTAYGTGWDQCEWSGSPYLDYRGKVLAPEILPSMTDAKIVLNTMTWFLSLIHIFFKEYEDGDGTAS